MSRPKWQHRVVLGAKLLFAPIAFLFIAWFAWQSREVIAEVFSRAHWGLLVMAVVAWVFSHLFSPLFYVQVFRPCGFNLNYRSALIIHARYLPARYIPGGIWHTVGRVAEFRSLGVDPKSLATFLFLENLLAVAITFLFGALILCFQKGWMLWGGGMLLISILAFSALIIGFVVVNTRRLMGENFLHIPLYLGLIAIVMLFWLFAATAFVLYVSAVFIGFGVPSITETVGTYLFSWGVGYVSLFAPQGIGVFEVVVSALFDSDAPASALIVVVAGFRVVVLIADMVVYSFVKLSY